jgi:hypothetical protein
MALRSDIDQLDAAWEALDSEYEALGWRTIHMKLASPCRVMAGRHYPGNEEALLIGFQAVHPPPDNQLPQGRGFLVTRIAGGPEPAGAADWFCLSRKMTGSIDLFRLMAKDIFNLLEAHTDKRDELLLKSFLGRIRAWQQFMEKGKEGILEQEAELGLLGEIVTLRTFLEFGLEGHMALDAWKGPCNELQDFIFSGGAIEVKSTLARRGFPAQIGSLEQLDESLRSPLFIAGVRFALNASGQTLPGFIEKLREALNNDLEMLAFLETRLLEAGYLEKFADMYQRRFVYISTVIYAVKHSFPKLTCGNVDAGIRKVRYEIDLDLVGVPSEELSDVLSQIGVIGHGT